MDPFIWIAYALSLGFVVANLYRIHRRLKELKEKVGLMKAAWSSLFSLSLPFSWVRGAAAFLYFGWGVIYQLIQNPKANGGHMSLMLLAVLLSFAPRGNVYIGSEGLIFRMKFQPWEEILEKRVEARGRAKYLVTNSWKLRLPRKVADWISGQNSRPSRG